MVTTEAFFKELQRIINSLPKRPLFILNSETTEIGDKIIFSKNLFTCFDCVNCTDCLYLYDSYMTANSADCDYAVESQNCYESVDPLRCFNCDYIEYCAHLSDSSYCYNCWAGSNLFGCVNFRNQNKSFCIFNRQLTEQEYREKVKIYKAWPAERVLEEVEKLKKMFPVTQTIEAHNENTTYGNYIHYSKNCYMCFDAAHNENCSYLYDSFYNKNCFDLTYSGQDDELCYEGIDSAHSFNCNYALESGNCQDSSYIFYCLDVKDSLGCIGLSHKQYCILNRQLSKEEYEQISRQIIMELKTKNPGWNSLSY